MPMTATHSYTSHVRRFSRNGVGRDRPVVVTGYTWQLMDLCMWLLRVNVRGTLPVRARSTAMYVAVKG